VVADPVQHEGGIGPGGAQAGAAIDGLPGVVPCRS
jgi:hypothetical protein